MRGSRPRADITRRRSCTGSTHVLDNYDSSCTTYRALSLRKLYDLTGFLLPFPAFHPIPSIFSISFAKCFCFSEQQFRRGRVRRCNFASSFRDFEIFEAKNFKIFQDCEISTIPLNNEIKAKRNLKFSGQSEEIGKK